MGTLVHGNFGGAWPEELTKAQFAAHPRVRRSQRWVELRVKDGMPSRMDGNRRMFPTQECLAWLESRERGAA